MGRPDESSESERHETVPRTDSVEFAEQFKASFRTLWTIAVAIVRDAALAEDVVQDAAIIALGKLDQYEPGSNFGAWMARMVRFVALNQSRKTRSRHAMPIDPDGFGDGRGRAGGADDPSRQDSHQRRIDSRIMSALDDVSDVARACLLLRILDGMAYAEIARMLDIPEGTAMSHVHRTKRHLREKLSGWRSFASDGRAEDE